MIFRNHPVSPLKQVRFCNVPIYAAPVTGGGRPLLYLFLFLMVANCGIYAITWQQVIKKFSLSTAYANKSVYLLWSQIWAVLIFHENLSIQNIIGILVVLFGVWTVQRYE